MSLMVGDTRGSNPLPQDPSLAAPVGLLVDAAVDVDPPRPARADGASSAQALRELSARRTRLASILTAIMMLGYFGFILLVAFDKPLVGTLLAGGRISLGIILGASAILLAPILTAIYVRWANNHYDAALEALRGGRR